ncbi:hypothetical protein LguiA_014904 [Lonicera macranthoides]
MGALSAALIAIGGLALGWITIEMVCKTCLDKGRDRNLNPDYGPDDDQNNAIRAPLNPNPPPPQPHPHDGTTSTVVKITSS